ncbi:MAG: hypothetical protein APU95_04915 [Hadesarchaea archaeon YNP_N21]|jgi:membrane associated rhomboid family serine protease|nr:MAG: hypothetical protein APU95_04915 [Hadesarchaea archaeon YNP_N21]
MFPLKDDNPTETKPFLTIFLIVINVAIFIYSLLSGSFEEIIYDYGMKPKTLIAEPYTLFTSMFLHGGFLHIIGNMWYLWIFGDNIEDICGRRRFLLLYVLSGVAAGLIHALSDPKSAVPTVGASGAIAGILGAYAVLYPRAKVYTAVVIFYFIQIIMVPALFLLGFWFILQLLSASITWIAGAQTGVAYWAHVGGFVAGAVLIWPLKKRRRRY